MFLKPSIVLLFVLGTTTGSLICSQETPETMSLNVIRQHFGSDRAISQKSNGHFPTAQSIIDYISHSQDIALPSQTSFLQSLDLIDAAKTAQLKRVFGCPGEPSDLDTDEISERKEVIGLLIGFALKIHINKKIQTLADRNRILNILKDELAQGTNTVAQETNRTELSLLQTEARNLADEIKTMTRNSMAGLLEQIPLTEREAVVQELASQSGLLTESLFAIVATE